MVIKKTIKDEKSFEEIILKYLRKVFEEILKSIRH